MKIGDLIKYVCEKDGKRCGQCPFCAPHRMRAMGWDTPSEESTRIGLVLRPAGAFSFDCQFDFGIWDVWPNEIEVISGT